MNLPVADQGPHLTLTSASERPLGAGAQARASVMVLGQPSACANKNVRPHDRFVSLHRAFAACGSGVRTLHTNASKPSRPGATSIHTRALPSRSGPAAHRYFRSLRPRAPTTELRRWGAHRAGPPCTAPRAQLPPRLCPAPLMVSHGEACLGCVQGHRYHNIAGFA